MKKKPTKTKVDYVPGFLALGGILAFSVSIKIAWPALLHLGSKLMST